MTTQLAPFAWVITVGTASAQILPQNPGRRGLMFHNPGTNTISVCPAFTSAGVAVPAVLNGAGAITIFPGGLLTLPFPGMEAAGLGASFNGIASAPSSPFTVWEF